MVERKVQKWNWPQGVRRPSRDGRRLASSVFPIMPFERNSPTTVRADTRNIGSAFFITRTGAFLTARHLVEDYANGEDESALAVLLMRPASRMVRGRIRHLQLHPTLDIAFGHAAIGENQAANGPPPWLRALTLSRRPLTRDDAIAVYGYSHTRAIDVGPRGLSLGFWPTDHHGHVIAARAPGVDGYRGNREYVIDAETLGGASGAPVVCRSTLAVHAVISTGISDACGFATDVREFVDSWTLDALGGTIAAYAAKRPTELTLR